MSTDSHSHSENDLDADSKTIDTIASLTSAQKSVLQASVLIVALCGIVYELIIATISAYLLGDSVYQFSLTIGLFMFAMGMGSLLTRRLQNRLIDWFIATEVLIALIGGLSSVLLFIVFPWTIFYKPVMYALILVIGGLVGLEIPLLMRILSDSGGFRKSIAQVLALDYFGALVGSVAFPLLLLPYLGLFRASFSIGLLNGLIALLNIVIFSNTLRRPRLWLAAISISMIVLFVAVLYASAIKSFAQGQLYSDQVVFSKQTPYQNVILTRNEFDGQHRLYVDGHLQFAEKDEYRYHEALVHPVMSMDGKREEVLILGGGDGLATREVLKYSEVKSIDLVDIDPEITRLCRDFPAIRKLNQGALANPKVQVHNVDAFHFLRNSKRFFDRIIIDLPDPHNEALSKLYSEEFYTLVRHRLASDGFFVTQSTSPWVTRKSFWTIGNTIDTVELPRQSYHVLVPNFGDWGFHLAGPARKTDSDQNQPPAPQITVATRFLTDEIFQKATLFAPDSSQVETGINSIFEPNLYLLYLSESRH